MNDKITLALTPQRLDYVYNVLAQRPYAEVAPIIADIQQQVALQRLPEAASTSPIPNGHDGHKEVTQ